MSLWHLKNRYSGNKKLVKNSCYNKYVSEKTLVRLVNKLVLSFSICMLIFSNTLVVNGVEGNQKIESSNGDSSKIGESAVVDSITNKNCRQKKT